ncbi:hypothetical protein [Duganella sp. BJB1802]|uniref:hypothetical protein n=1 Tax=Duganella sp. BJB1802 TaxID=2744575 RepID=UPI001E5552DE|nr:hypothetical protein [Duganella sp. BJB1802]
MSWLYVDDPVASAAYYADLLGQQPVDVSHLSLFALSLGPMLARGQPHGRAEGAGLGRWRRAVHPRRRPVAACAQRHVRRLVGALA